MHFTEIQSVALGHGFLGGIYEGRSKSFEPHPFKRKVDK